MHPFATKNIIYFCLNPSFIILFCCLIEDMNLEKCLSLAIIIHADVEVAPEFNRVTGIENKPCAEVFLVVLSPESYSQITDSGHVIFQYRRSLRPKSKHSQHLDRPCQAIPSSANLALPLSATKNPPFTFIPECPLHQKEDTSSKG